MFQYIGNVYKFPNSEAGMCCTVLHFLHTLGSLGSTQLSIPPGSVNEYQLWLGRQRQVNTSWGSFCLGMKCRVCW